MKKYSGLFLIVIFSYSHAQLNLEWGSYITLNHPAINATYSSFTDFGSALASKDDELVIGANDYRSLDLSFSGAIFYLKSAEGGAIRPLEWVSGNGRYSQSSISGATPESQDRFGSSVSIIASSNNSSKVLIGVPNEDIGDINAAGMIHEMFIDSNGVDFLNYHQDTSGVQGIAEPNDLFGSAVVWGDFDNDANWDAAIGVSGESVDGHAKAGAVNVIMGASDGMLNTGNDQIWTQSSFFIQGTPEDDERFGSVLAVGDFNKDGRSDLAIGVPNDIVDGIEDAGSVNVIYGGSDGLGASGDQIWNQNTPGIGGSAESGDRFGYSLEVGDFNGDEVDDLAIGIPFEAIVSNSQAGAVQIIYGKDNEGLVSSGSLFISQDEAGFAGLAESGDRFGYSLASGRLNNDSYHDLAIGIPGESVGDINNAGSVVIVHGSSSGIQFNDEYFITENHLSIPGGVRVGRFFGSALTSSDFDNDNKHDLAITSDPDGASLSRPESIAVAYRRLHDIIFENGFEE